MKHVLLALAIFLSASIGFAQPDESDFGKITLDDFKPLAADTAASVVLINWGKYEITSSFDYPGQFQRFFRIKINNKSHADYWGNFVLGNTLMKVTNVKAVTYNLEHGNVVTSSLNRDDILTDKNERNTKTFTLPNIKEGSILELSFTWNYKYYALPSWRIQFDVPVIHSEYIAKFPVPVGYLLVGEFKPHQANEKLPKKFTRWTFTNVPPYTPEPNMPAFEDNHARMEFWTMGNTWNAISKEFHFTFQENFMKFESRPVKQKTQEITAGVEDPLGKMKAIERHVKENYLWDGTKTYVPRNFTDAIKEPRLNSGEINTLLYAMLRSADLQAGLVLLATSDVSPLFKSAPSLYQFNYVICRVTYNGESYLLDATHPTLPFAVLPEYCTKTEGLVVSDRAPESWVEIPIAGKEKFSCNARLKITDDLSLRGKVTSVFTSYSAASQRKQLRKRSERGYIEDFIKDRSLWSIDSMKILNGTDYEAPLTETVYGSISEQVVETPSHLLVNPYIVMNEVKDQWKNSHRTHPIDFRNPSEKLLMVFLEVPDGYEIESVPSEKIFTAPGNDMSCTFKVSISGKIVVVLYKINIVRTRYESSEYEGIRNFYQMILAKQNEPILLKKKATIK